MRKIAILILFVLFLNIFLFHPVGPVSFVLFCLGLFIFLLGIYSERKIPIPTFLGLGAFFVLSSYGIIGRGNGFVNFIESISLLAILVLSTYLLGTHLPFVRSLMEMVLVPFSMLSSYIKAGINLLRTIISDEWKKHIKNVHISQEKISLVKSIGIGLVVGLPIVFILTSLLSGDPIFGAFVKNSITNLYKLIPLKNIDQFLIRIIYNLFFLALFSPFIFLKRDREFTSPVSFLEKYHLTKEVTVVMTLVALTLGIFLLVQWPYIFINVPAETDLSKYGVATYSEYVRKGFLELLFVSFFVYSLIWVGLISLRGKVMKKMNSLFLVQMIVIGEFFLFLVSIFRRIFLYQQYHGWSLVRIYGGIFLIWVTMIAITLFLRHYMKKRFIITEGILTAILILFFGFFNAESFIVNNHPPTVNKHIDYVYLSRMSPDGYEGWKEAYANAKKVLENKKLDQEVIINKDQRREISYAMLITRALSKRYHLLINDYGNEKELRDYYRKILLTLKEQNTRFPSADQQYYENRRKIIEKNLIWVDDSKKPIEEIASQFYVDGGYYYLHYDPNSAPLEYYFIASENKNIGKSKSALDKVFIWNFSKEQAFQKMKNDIPYEKLLSLQNRAHLLYRKIALQPEKEREYETDISFDTPFLEPL